MRQPKPDAILLRLRTKKQKAKSKKQKAKSKKQKAKTGKVLIKRKVIFLPILHPFSPALPSKNIIAFPCVQISVP
jgi:hypothetical protein